MVSHQFDINNDYTVGLISPDPDLCIGQGQNVDCDTEPSVIVHPIRVSQQVNRDLPKQYLF